MANKLPTSSCRPAVRCCSRRASKEHRGAVFKAVLVRLLLIAHIILTIWRVSLAWDDTRFWLWSLGTLIIIFEGQFTILQNKGLEWKWFCPVLAIYLATVLPLIWFLEIAQMNKYIDSSRQSLDSTTPASTTITTLTTNTTTSTPVSSYGETAIKAFLVTMESNTSVSNSTLGVTSVLSSTLPVTSLTNEMTPTSTTPKVKDLINNLLLRFNADTWVVTVEESLVYLIVIGRWLLPRGDVTREALSDLLMDYLAMASDIMELFALFDQEEVRGNARITYVILAVWSVSFLQFIPVMVNRRVMKAEKSAGSKNNNKNDASHVCGEYGIDIFVAMSSLVLQDGPFLVLRLFIIVYLRILTYSLVFFILKNIIVVLLLTYRLFILCTSMPCCTKVGFDMTDGRDSEIDNQTGTPLIHRPSKNT